MSSKTIRLTAVSAVCVCAFAATAEVMDRPQGIKIGQRMTLRPYVSMSAAYDSNVGSRTSGAKGDVMWNINPGFSLDYKQEKWSLLLTGTYAYHAYSESRNSKYKQHSYGENLRWNWSDGDETGKGWSIMIDESYRRVSMADDFHLSDGRRYNADRGQFYVNGAVQRRFNENWHANVMGGYYNLEYDNDTDKGTGLYGWQRWTAQADMGFAPSPWTDFIAMVGYQGYNQDNAGTTTSGKKIDRRSDGYTAQMGIGSFATERISYRLLAGWSRFDYGHSSADNGFIYTGSLNWKLSDTLQTMLVASSYYQPSEYERASKSRIDSLSWGLHKALVRGKLNATFDLTYRHENIERVSGAAGSDYELDTLSGRLGLDYTLNRFFAIFAYGEYLRSWDDSKGGYYDYDRWRVTGGVRLTY